MPPSDPSGLRPMLPERFRRLVETYGAEVERWPETERPAAWALLALSAEAKEAWREAAPLDQALRTVTPPPTSDALAARLSDLPLPSDKAKPNSSRRWRWIAYRWLAWPVAVAATAMLFFALGLSAPGLWRSPGQPPIEPPRLAALEGDTGFDGTVIDAPLVGGLTDDTNLYDSDVIEFVEFETEDGGDTASSEGDFLATLPLY